MISTKFETLAIWLIVISAPTFILSAVTFNSTLSYVLAALSYTVTMLAVAAFPLGLWLLLVSQIIKFLEMRT